MTSVAANAVKLNLGSGNTLVTGYVNIDDDHPAADVRADMRRLPYADGAVDEIYCSHALEHLPRGDIAATLTEWRRVLRAGGKLGLVVPNLDWVAAAWLHGSDRGYARQIMFGNQQHPGEFHKTGWAKQDLVDDVEEAGFTVAGCVVRWTAEYSQESIILEATA